MTETAQDYEQIEQQQRDSHAPLPVREPEPLYFADADAFEVIDATH